MTRTASSLLASTLLLLLGWEPVGREVFRLQDENERLVVIFSHSSYSDFLLLALYSLAYSFRSRSLFFVVHPGALARWGLFLRPFGALEGTKLEEKNGGSVDRLVSLLEGKDRFSLLISPKGQLCYGPWRSGYYFLSHRLNCPLVVGGLDYREKRMVVREPFRPESLREAEERGKRDLRTIAARYGPSEIGSSPGNFSPFSFLSLLWFLSFSLLGPWALLPALLLSAYRYRE